MALALALTLGAGCDSGGDDATGSKRDGGGAGRERGDAGGSGTRGDASLGVDAGAGPDAGSSGSRDGGAAMVSSEPGVLSDYWKQVSAEFLSLDISQPLARFDETTADIPALVPDPIDGLDTDVYYQIVDGQLVTYAYRSGETVYYRLTQALLEVDETSYALTASGGIEQHFYTLEAGFLVDTGSLLVGQMQVSSTTRYRKLNGSFPPSSWPTTMLEGTP